MSRAIHLLVGTLILLALSGPVACGSKSDGDLVKDTVAGFWDTYNRDEFDRSSEFFSGRVRADYGDESLINRVREGKVLGGEVRLSDFQEPAIDGSKATIWVTVTPTKLIERQTQYSLIREDGKWRIDNEASCLFGCPVFNYE